MDIKEFVHFSRGLVPRQNYGNIEKAFWKTDIDSKINGEVVSLDKLKEYFPADENFSEADLIEDNQRYKVYGRTYKNLRMPEKVAYECKQCNSLIVGMPVFGEEDGIGPLAGRRGSSLECKHCHAELKFTGIVS